MLESIGVSNLWVYIIGALAIVLVPGPNSIFVMTSSIASGIKNGYKAAFGIFFGDSVLILLSFLGVATLLNSQPHVFLVVKYLGAAYLVFLGLKVLLSKANKEIAEGTGDKMSPAHSGREVFGKAFILSCFNPKMIIFYVSFFIQFIDEGHRSDIAPYLFLGGILEILSLLYLSVLIVCISPVAEKFKGNARFAKTGKRCVGVVFLMFGLKVALTT